jgi:hypothetical protein
MENKNFEGRIATAALLAAVVGTLLCAGAIATVPCVN